MYIPKLSLLNLNDHKTVTSSIKSSYKVIRNKLKKDKTSHFDLKMEAPDNHAKDAHHGEDQVP